MSDNNPFGNSKGIYHPFFQPFMCVFFALCHFDAFVKYFVSLTLLCIESTLPAVEIILTIEKWNQFCSNTAKCAPSRPRVVNNSIHSPHTRHFNQHINRE